MTSNGTKEKALTFDFSHLYRTETVDVTAPDGVVMFSAVIRMITHGEKSDAQARLMANVDIPMSKNKERNRLQIEASMKDALKKGAMTESAELEAIAAIQSWTLTEADGSPVDVSVAAWRALPEYCTSQIEEVIERLNPDLDDEFHGDDGGES